MPGNKQSVETVKHTLQLDENLPQHKRGWVIQKVGWAVLYIGLVLAMLGLFGSGPLSYKKQTINGNSIEYERFLRYEGESEMTFRITGVLDTFTIQVPRHYAEYVKLQSISPVPVTNRMVDGETTYYFRGQGTATVHCDLMAKKPGNVTATIVVNKTPFTIAHQIYP